MLEEPLFELSKVMAPVENLKLGLLGLEELIAKNGLS